MTSHRAADGRPLGHVRSDRRGLSSSRAPARKATARPATSQHTLELIDEEVRRILTECAEEAQRTLAEHREQLEHLAQALLERETLDEADAYAVAGIVRRPATEQPVAAQA